jgi:N-acetylmuramoyl-L-alanine amidase
LQAALKQAGYLKGQVTGFFGKLTEDALIKFQQAQGLPADGVAGPQTQEALRRVIASGVTTNGRESGG